MKRHRAVGIVFPDLLGSYYSEVALGYEQAAVGAERSVLILATHGRVDSDELVLDLADRVDGLVVMDRTVSDDVVRDLELGAKPVVLLARPAVGPTPSVRTENTRSATTLVAHLVGHGHQRMAFLGDPDAAPDVEERWAGFRQAHADAGLAVPDKPARCGFLPEDGFAAASGLLDADARPTALVCANDEIALGAYLAAREQGLRLPSDVAVTGWDDNTAAGAVTPTLTTVRQPLRELGRRAGDLLSARIGAGEATSLTLPTTVVIRNSCGCPGAGGTEITPTKEFG